jgi:hypothetical protein
MRKVADRPKGTKRTKKAPRRTKARATATETLDYGIVGVWIPGVTGDEDPQSRFVRGRGQINGVGRGMTSAERREHDERGRTIAAGLEAGARVCTWEDYEEKRESRLSAEALHGLCDVLKERGLEIAADAVGVVVVDSAKR